MKISVIQQDLLWKDVRGNLAKAEEAAKKLSTGERPDLMVFPEMFSTGFVTDPSEVAQSVEGESLKWMRQKAVEFNCAFSTSVAVEENGCYYNRLYFVTPCNSVHYDKRHLFGYGGEGKLFSAGGQRKIAEYEGFKFLLQVCYDLRFPVFARNNAGDPYDAIIYVASWPVARIEAWRTLLKARALENQCYVIGVNRVGADPNCRYNGYSAIIDPYGRALKEAKSEGEEIISADLNIAELQAFRKKFPVLEDGDKFTLNL